MARRPNHFSRVSLGWVTSTQSIVDVDPADTGAAVSVTGDVVFDDDVTITGTQTFTGAATFSSTVTASGQITASSGIAVGGGTNIVAISTSTHENDLGTIAAQDSSSITVGHSGATRGDTFIVTRDSEFSGADNDIVIYAYSGDTAGEVNVVAVNSTLTAVDTTVGVFRLTRINFGSYI